jgi:ankyrin repeat protein
MNGDTDLAMYLTNLALIEAIRVDDASRLLDLVDSGGNPNTKNPMGWTPLIYMTSRRDPRSVRRIIAAGANANIAENDGWYLSFFFFPLFFSCLLLI